MWTFTPGPYTDAFRLLGERCVAALADILQLIQRSFGTRPKFNTAFAREYAYSSGPFNSHLLVVSVFDLESQSNSTCIHEYEMYASTSLCLNDKRPQS